MTFILAAWLGFFSPAARAESFGDVPPPESADLSQCYSWAVEQAESLRMQEEQIYQLEQQYKQVLASALPNLNFFAQEKWQDTSSPLAAAGGVFFASPQPNVGFSLAQPLFSGFREFAAMKSFKHQGQAAELSLRHAQTLLYQNVVNAFYLVLNLETQLADTRMAVDLATARLKELRRFEDLGKSRHSEVTLVESQEATLEASAEIIKGQIDAARAVLSFLTGKDMGQAKLTDKLDRIRALDGEEAALGRALDRSDVRSLRKTVESQEDQIRLAKGAYLPTVSFLGNYYTQRTTFLAPIGWDATISGTVPLFQGGGQLAAVRQAKSQLSQAQYNLEMQLRQARTDIHTAFTALRAAFSSAEAAERAYVKADETYRVEDKEYRLGLVNNLDVMTALNSMIAAKTSFDQILIQMKIDSLQLKIADEELP